MLLLLACTGPEPDPAETVQDGGYLAVDPATVEFGGVDQGTAVDLALTLTNLGDAPLRLDGATVEGEAFTVVDLPDARIPAAGSALLTVRFAPTAHGPATGTLVLAASAENAPVEVSLAGVAVAAAMELSPEEHDYGDVGVGCTRTVPLKVSNQGDGWLSIIAVALETATPEAFITDLGADTLGPLPWSVEPGGSTHFQVSFAPASVGPATATITVTGNDPAAPTQAATFAGIGAKIACE